eukprot:1148392-Pelagomonas_calceolata.AAC.9
MKIGAMDSSHTTYTLVVYTADVPGAGTDANVSVNIVGTEGESGPRQLTVCLAAGCCFGVGNGRMTHAGAGLYSTLARLPNI